MSAATRPELALLSERLSIAPSYFDLSGHERHASDATREALCAAQGFACASEAEARASLAALDADARARVIEPVHVLREHAHARPGLRAIPPASFRPSDAGLEIRFEDGGEWRGELRLPAGDGHALAELPLPLRLPVGAHALRLSLGGPEARSCEQTLVVAPRSCPLAHDRLGDARALGLWASLYTVRSARGFGFGDFADLERLARLSAELGADFLALNPLHALLGRGNAIAPYSPLSRVFQNALYLDVESVPELADCAEARTRLAAAPLARLRAARELDYAAVFDAKLDVLRPLHACFCRAEAAHPTARGRAFAEFRAQGGRALEDFARFCALQAELGEPDWRRWPAELRDPRSAAVAERAARLAGEVELHAWLQFELDVQLERAARAGRDAGLALGFVKDLAIGSAADSADAWANPDLFARGASLGAPPDVYSATGQDWGLPPLVPGRLRAEGYAFLRRVLRAAFRGAGALRIDHVMGLARQFWIPAGRPGSEGAYVRQPQDELFGIVALESQYAGALVIGEDLGTVPPELGPELASWGILSTRVLCFERQGPRYRASGDYPARALVLATTHDLPPLSGYFAGRDLELRAALEPGGSPEELAAERRARAEERAALCATLRDEGDLPADDAPVADAELGAALCAHLGRTPARLVALGLDDLAGESEPLNLPGVPVERHRSWSRRMLRTLDDLPADPRVRAGIERAARRLAPGAARPDDGGPTR